MKLFNKLVNFAKAWLFILRLSFLQIKQFPINIAFKSWIRYFFLAVIFRRLRLYNKHHDNSESIAKNTISHNLKGFSIFGIKAFSGFRPNILLRIIDTIELIDKKKAKALFIGCRAESELFLARSYGFKRKNIRGLDLISYSKNVDLGDMHHMSYNDDSWDVIMLGWVIAYSESPQQVCNEVIRVAKNKAVVAFGIQYHPLSPEEIGEKLGYVPGASKRIEFTKEILDMFKGHVNNVFFAHDIDEERRDKPGDILLVFSIKK